MCIHEYEWKDNIKDTKVFKIHQCSLCGHVEDVVVKDMGKPEVDKNQAYYDGMFKCINAVKKEHPEFTDEVVSHYAISLFIQLARR